MARYATAAQFLERYDWRTIADLVSDGNVRPSRMALESEQPLTTSLDDASGDIDAALLTGKLYSTGDLEGLTGNAAHHLERMTCDIAMSHLHMRRPGKNPELADVYHKRSHNHLEKLRKGHNVFNLDAQQTVTNPTIDGPTSVDYARINSVVDRTQRYYPDRANRLPTDRN